MTKRILEIKERLEGLEKWKGLEVYSRALASDIQFLINELDRVRQERDTAWQKNSEYFRLLRECKELTYKHNPALNIRICDALTDY